MFDWPELLKAGLQRLGLAPDEFWALTPAELRLMLGEGRSSAPLARDGLEALLQRYPDETERKNHE